MNDTNQKVVTIDPKLVDRHELNRKPPPGHVRELMKSIKSIGQITPALLRVHPVKKGRYQVAAGACRVAACAAMNIGVKAVVEALDDQAFTDMLVVENMQREDVDPYVEADIIAALIEQGRSVTEFAAAAGKDTKWIKSRVRLTNLDRKILPKVRERWPLDVIEALADYPHPTQHAMIEHFTTFVPSIERLHQVGSNRARPLTGVDFLKDPDTAVGKCGEGGCCMTNADMLFQPEDKCLACMNPDCFDKRQAKFMAKIYLQTEKQFPGRVYVMSDVAHRINKNLDNPPKIALEIAAWTPRSELGIKAAKPNDKTLYLLAFDKKDHAFEVWPFNRRPEKKDKEGKDKGAGASADPLKAAEEKAGNRTAMLKGKRFLALLAHVLEKLETHKFTATFEMIAAFGTREHYAGHDRDRWTMLRDGKFKFDRNDGGREKVMSAKEFVTELVRDQMIIRLENKEGLSKVLANSNLVAEVRDVADFMGLDLKAAEEKIAREMPPPKSWGDAYDPITLKPKKH